MSIYKILGYALLIIGVALPFIFTTAIHISAILLFTSTMFALSDVSDEQTRSVCIGILLAAFILGFFGRANELGLSITFFICATLALNNNLSKGNR